MRFTGASSLDCEPFLRNFPRTASVQLPRSRMSLVSISESDKSASAVSSATILSNPFMVSPPFPRCRLAGRNNANDLFSVIITKCMGHDQNGDTVHEPHRQPTFLASLVAILE